MQRATHHVRIFLIVAALIFLTVRFGLFVIPEPEKAVIWRSLPTAGLLVGASLIVVALLDLWKSKANTLRSDLLLTCIGLAIILLPWSNAVLGLEYPASISRTEGALAIRVPVDGAVTVAWGGDSIHQNYHAEYADQRWAYDLVMTPHSLGNDSNNESFGCFGTTVLAPISGEVRSAVDGEPDREPDDRASDVQNAFGNYVVLKPNDTDGRLIIAHLKQGSLRVERGDVLEEGQPIAECGNSGNSTEPHIHIHYIALHQFNGETVMTGLPLYFRDHDGPEMPVGGFTLQNGREIASGDVIQHIKPD